MTSDKVADRPARRGRMPGSQVRVYTGLRITPEVRQRIEARAVAENRTVSAMVETLVIRALDADDGKIDNG